MSSTSEGRQVIAVVVARAGEREAVAVDLDGESGDSVDDGAGRPSLGWPIAVRNVETSG